VHVDAAAGVETALSFYIGKRPDGSLMMVNATPGLDLEHEQIRFTGASSSALLDAFDGDNHLPAGAVRFRIPGGQLAGVDAAERTIITTGETTFGTISGVLGVAGLILSIAAIPFTAGGSAVGTVLLLGGAAAGVASGAFALADHLASEETPTDAIALDCLQIAASALDLGVAFKALRSSPAMIVANRTARYMLWGSLAVQGASAMLLSVEAISQIEAILDGPGSRQDKLMALTRVIATLIVTGAILAISYRDLTQARTRINQLFPRIGRPLTDIEYASLGLLDDTLLRTMGAARREDLERLAAMIQRDPALVTRLPMRTNVYSALRGCTTLEPNELELRLFRQRLNAAGVQRNSAERVMSALDSGGIDGATAHLMTDDDLARLGRADTAFAAGHPADAQRELDAITGVDATTRGTVRGALAHTHGMSDPAFVADPFMALRTKFPRLHVDDLATLATLDHDALRALETASESDVRRIAALIRARGEADAEDILQSFMYKAEKAPQRQFQPPTNVANRLEASLDNLAAARRQGHPFGFADTPHYQRFMTRVRGSLTSRGLPVGDVRVHGSALHNRTPKDVDVAVIVDDDTFNRLGAAFAAGAPNPRTVQAEVTKGKIPSHHFYPNNAPSVAVEAASETGELAVQVSLIRRGSPFDLGPYLDP
jgi:hypothetical protein